MEGVRVQIQGSKEGRESVSLEVGKIQRREGERREFKSKVHAEEGTSLLSSNGRETGRGSVSKVQRKRVKVQGLQEGGSVRRFKPKVQNESKPSAKQREGDR